MQLGLTEEQELLQSSFSELFAAESSPERVRTAEETGFDAGLWKHLIETGAIGIRVADELGGSGGGLHDAAILAEQAGRALVSAPLVEAISAAGLLARIESDAARAALAEILEGGRIPTLALREMNGSATQLVPGGAAADAVLALDADSLVLLRRPRSTAERPAPNLGSGALERWRFDVAPPDGERLALARGAAARNAYRAAVEEWRLLTAAALAGLAQRALEIGADYAKSRIQFDQPIGSFQGLAHPFADAATAVAASQLLVQYAIWSVATAQPEAAARICFAFAAAAEGASTAAAHALHTHGGYGVSLEYDIQLYYRRAKAWALVGGDPRDELLRLRPGRRGRAIPRRGARLLRARAHARAPRQGALQLGRTRRRLPEKARGGGPAVSILAERLRWARLEPLRVDRALGGVSPRRLVDPRGDDDGHGRRVADPVRQRGAQAGGPAARPRGRGDHQPRLHRAGLGIGRRRRPDARGARR
jgi:alkylation response protein AidB-like acyl-CoA dehydrogenase